MLDHVATLKSSPSAMVCALVVLAGLERAAAKAQQRLPQELLQRTASWLCSADLRSMSHAEVHTQAVMVIANLIDLAHEQVAGVASPLFHALMHLEGQQGLDAYTDQQISQVRACACTNTTSPGCAEHPNASLKLHAGTAAAGVCVRHGISSRACSVACL
jgi:hypothetical protein